MLACLLAPGRLPLATKNSISKSEGAVLSATYIQTDIPPPRLSLARTPPPPLPPSNYSQSCPARQEHDRELYFSLPPSLPPLPPSLRPSVLHPLLPHHTTGRNMATMEGWLQVPVERNLMGRAGTWKVHSMFQNPHRKERKERKRERERKKPPPPQSPPISSPPVPCECFERKGHSSHAGVCLPSDPDPSADTDETNRAGMSGSEPIHPPPRRQQSHQSGRPRQLGGHWLAQGGWGA